MRIILLIAALAIIASSCETSNEYQNNNSQNDVIDKYNPKDTGGVDRDYPRNNNGEWPQDTPHRNNADTTARDRMPGTK